MLDTLKRRYRNSPMLSASAWYVSSTFIQKAILLLAVPIFTRLLTPDEYGTVALYAIWANVFLIIFPLNVQASALRAWFDLRERFAGYLSAIFALGLLPLGLGIVLLIALPDGTVAALFRLEKTFVIAAGLSALLTFPQRLVLSGWQATGRYRAHAILSAGTVAAATGLGILFLAALPAAQTAIAPPWARIGGLLLVAAITAAYLSARLVREGRTGYDATFWRYALAYSAPLIPHLLADVVLSQYDRVLIDSYVGRGESGVYAFAYQIGEVVFMLWFATHMAWQPWFHDRMTAGDTSAIRRKAARYQVAITGLTALLILGGSLIVPVIAPEAYWGAAAVIPVIMAGNFFRYLHTFYLHVELHEKKTVYVSVATILAALVNVGLNLALLPRYGYPAAAWATLIAYALLFLLHAAIVRFLLKRRGIFNFPLMLGLGAAIAGVAVLVYAIIAAP